MEGLRVQKDVVVGFGGDNTIRIRFRPTTVPTEETVDFQPMSRVFTALVLVRNRRSVCGSSCDHTGACTGCSCREEDQEKPGSKKAGCKQRYLSVVEASIHRSAAPTEYDGLEQALAELQRTVSTTPLVSHLRGIERQLDSSEKALAQRLQENELAPSTRTVVEELQRGISKAKPSAGWSQTFRTVSTATPDWSRGRLQTLLRRLEQVQPQKDDLSVAIDGMKNQSVVPEINMVMPQDKTLTAGWSQITSAVKATRVALNDYHDRVGVDRHRSCQISTTAFFAPGLRDEAGAWSPPRSPFRVFSHPIDRLPADRMPEASPTTTVVKTEVETKATNTTYKTTTTVTSTGQTTLTAPVPLWPGPAIRPLKIANAFGYYWINYDDEKITARLTQVLASAYRVLEELKKPLDKAKGPYEKAKTAADTAKESLDKAKQAWDADPKNGPLKTLYEQSKQDFEAKKDAFKKPEEDYKKAKKGYDEQNKRIAAEKASLLPTLIAASAKTGRGYVGYRVESSPRWLSEDHDSVKCMVWVRLVAAEEPSGIADAPKNSGYDPGEFRLAGQGNLGGTIQIPRIDLSHSIPVLDPKEYATGPWKAVRVFLEAVLVEGSATKVEIDKAGEITLAGGSGRVFQRTVQEVVLEPRAKVPGKAPSPGVHSSGPRDE